MDMLVRGRYVITDPTAGEDSVLNDSTVLVSGGKIAAVSAYESLRAKHLEAKVMGTGRQLLMPGLIDGHGHGWGLSAIQRGIPYDNRTTRWSTGPSCATWIPDLTRRCAQCATCAMVARPCTTITGARPRAARTSLTPPSKRIGRWVYGSPSRPEFVTRTCSRSTISLFSRHSRPTCRSLRALWCTITGGHW